MQTRSRLLRPRLQDASACGIYTLYTQVRGSQGTQAEASSDSITLDQAIQASALIASLTSPGSPNVSPSGGESYPTAGESDWIRTPNYVYQVSDEPSVCSGLESYTAADTDDSIHSGSDTSAYLVTLDGKLLTAEGDGFAEQEVIATILFTDTLGNTGIATRTLYFDDDSPVITNAATPDLLTADNGGGTEALATLYFTDVLVSDDSYGAFIGQTDKAYWGIWALVTTQDLGDTPSGSDFFAGGAQVIELTPGATSVKMSLVSFTDSDPGSDPGTRYIYVRFLDGAGNFSSEVLRTTVTLAADYQLPTIHLPVTMR
ncbi:MAG: hypothetical protein KatS3mg057_2624 [Herpetosiphonaceae bacterium]|nr:MAG: hypothetical protein KatS3mg057_2624 [Herpetosiphonaceae bacterium]